MQYLRQELTGEAESGVRHAGTTKQAGGTVFRNWLKILAWSISLIDIAGLAIALLHWR